MSATLYITKKMFQLYNNAEKIEQIYTSYVWLTCILEYGAILWNLHNQHEIEVLENFLEKLVNLVYNNSIFYPIYCH